MSENTNYGAGDAIVAFENVSKIYHRAGENVAALDDVSLSMSAGDFVTLCGPSGCGKSTILHLAAGLDTPSEGRIFISGQNISSLSDTERSSIRCKDIGFVFQFFNLLPSLTTFENVASPLVLAGHSLASTKDAVQQSLQMLQIAELSDRYPSELSGGQMQRVAIARAVVHKPKVVLADEPTGNLDSANGKIVMDIFKKLHSESNTTILMATHDPNWTDVGTRALSLKDGKLQ